MAGQFQMMSSSSPWTLQARGCNGPGRSRRRHPLVGHIVVDVTTAEQPTPQRPVADTRSPSRLPFTAPGTSLRSGSGVSRRTTALTAEVNCGSQRRPVRVVVGVGTWTRASCRRARQLPGCSMAGNTAPGVVPRRRRAARPPLRRPPPRAHQQVRRVTRSTAPPWPAPARPPRRAATAPPPAPRRAAGTARGQHGVYGRCTPARGGRALRRRGGSQRVAQHRHGDAWVYGARSSTAA